MSSHGPRFGLVLGSGGARGWCHIGVLRELEALGLKPDVLAGCSMGALVGAAWAAGQLDALEDFALSLTPRRVLSMMDLRFGRGGLIAGAGIEALLSRIGLDLEIKDLPLPFIAIAANLSTGREIWLREGPVIEAVRASIAMPGVIAPKEIEGQWLIDGGVVNPVPVSAARAMGAEVVLAINPNARRRDIPKPSEPPPPSRFTSFWPSASTIFRTTTPEAPEPKLLPRLAPPPWLHLVTSTIDIMTDQIRRSRLAGDAPDLLLAANLQDMALLDFHHAHRAIEEGRRITRAHSAILETWLDAPRS